MIVNTYLYPVGVIVQQQHPRARHLLGLHHGLQISQQTHVFGHVSCQNLDKGERGGKNTVSIKIIETHCDLNQDDSRGEKNMNQDTLPCR